MLAVLIISTVTETGAQEMILRTRELGVQENTMSAGIRSCI